MFFFFNDTATTEIYTLSLHDALPILLTTTLLRAGFKLVGPGDYPMYLLTVRGRNSGDRKSTRLNSSHLVISYAVFCLKKKKLTERSVHTGLCVNSAFASAINSHSLFA